MMTRQELLALAEREIFEANRLERYHHNLIRTHSILAIAAMLLADRKEETA